MSALTVVMYHHVRDSRSTRFPAIPGLDIRDFRAQVERLAQQHTFVSLARCFETIGGGAPLPEKAMLLTFDDGYAEHFTTVFPWLEARGIPAVFFPPGRAVMRRELLDVHKIHYLLARVSGPAELEERFSRALGAFQITDEESSPSQVRFDKGLVARVKSCLQRLEPCDLRHRLVDYLFRELVSDDVRVLADELYLTGEQLQCMQRHGMAIGGHGWDHPWWDKLPDEEQRREIGLTLEFLSSLEISLEPWAFAYPFGSFSDVSERLLKEAGCVLAFTTKPEVARLEAGLALKLPRLDTNDFLPSQTVVQS